MLKIKTIDYTKVVYDESLSHNIFSIANITFSNAEPIYGALLYWRKNTDDATYTADDEYKFYYDMANTMFYAAVKYPKHVQLTKEQKRELSYILLEERGSVGSYSFPTSNQSKARFSLKKQFMKLQFPTHFHPRTFPTHIRNIVPQYEVTHLETFDYSHTFIEEYAKWRHQAVDCHPEDLEHYADYIDFSYICAYNPFLTEQYLVMNLSKIDWQMLATNLSVLNRLSEPFKAYVMTQLDKESEMELKAFLEQNETFEDDQIDLFDEQIIEEDEQEVELNYFAFDLGQNKWPGGEHLIKGIPSFAAQVYDDFGYKKKTNKEMDALTKHFTADQWRLASSCFDLHWLHRYKNQIDWMQCCLYHEQLTEAFIVAHIKFVDFEALGQNLTCELSDEFVKKYIGRFDHSKVIPLIIRHLTADLYLDLKDTITVDSKALLQYGETIDDEQFFALQALLEE